MEVQRLFVCDQNRNDFRGLTAKSHHHREAFVAVPVAILHIARRVTRSINRGGKGFIPPFSLVAAPPRNTQVAAALYLRHGGCAEVFPKVVAIASVRSTDRAFRAHTHLNILQLTHRYTASPLEHLRQL